MNLEINSFVSKLMQLNSFGLNASLSFQAHCGRIFVNLQADLGHGDSYHNGNNYHNVQTQTRVKKQSPSRRRRLRRRKASREASKGHDDAKDDVDHSEPEPYQPQHKGEEEQDSVELDINYSQQEQPSNNSDDEDEMNWTWTPPTEDDILHYLREQNLVLPQSHESQEEAAVSNTPMVGGVFRAGEVLNDRCSLNNACMKTRDLNKH